MLERLLKVISKEDVNKKKAIRKQYMWLTLNTLVPRIAHILFGSNSYAPYTAYKLLARLSEICRKHHLYKMYKTSKGS